MGIHCLPLSKGCVMCEGPSLTKRLLQWADGLLRKGKAADAHESSRLTELIMNSMMHWVEDETRYRGAVEPSRSLDIYKEGRSKMSYKLYESPREGKSDSISYQFTIKMQEIDGAKDTFWWTQDIVKCEANPRDMEEIDKVQNTYDCFWICNKCEDVLKWVQMHNGGEKS